MFALSGNIAMKIFINSRAISGAWGGANSFLNALCHEFRRYGIKVTHDSNDEFDIALLNALVPDVNLELVQSIHARGIPIMHRKTNYAYRGGEKMNRIVDGVVWGDKLQIDFTPYIHTSIFQSHYSRNVFIKSGYTGRNVIIYNGTNESIFSPFLRFGLFRQHKKLRSFWNGKEPLKVIISTWSKHPSKGFPYYTEIDHALTGRSDIQLSLVGRKHENVHFENIDVSSPVGAPKLADILRQNHVLLQLSKGESCSNAMIEGINCGLPVIYLDDSANKEVGAEYGVEFQGDFFEAIEKVKENYQLLVERTLTNPYRISLVARQYWCLIHKIYNL